MAGTLSASRRAAIILAAGAGAALLASGVRRRRRRMDFRDASIVITGGSRGLGLEMARLFGGEGARLTLLARDPDELERARRELAARGVDVLVHACDVGNREEVGRAVHYLIAERGRIDVLVNNAGVIEVAPFENLTVQDFEEALGVHAWGPLYATEAVVPHMKRQGGGRIVTITSIAGAVSIPHLLSYSMSKSALIGLSDGLRAELAQYGILVTTVVPGLMRTGSHVKAFYKGRNEKEYAWFASLEGIPLFSTDSRKAARKIVAACRYGAAHLTITPLARILVGLNALMPAFTAALAKFGNRLLPDPAGPHGNRRFSGWESRSPAAPSLLTRLADKAIARNNER